MPKKATAATPRCAVVAQFSGHEFVESLPHLPSYSNRQLAGNVTQWPHTCQPLLLLLLLLLPHSVALRGLRQQTELDCGNLT